MLETFHLRKQLEATREELSQALYQHDAACRVIARLIKERDAARAALTAAQSAIASRLAVTPAAAAAGAGDVEMAGAYSRSLARSLVVRHVASHHPTHAATAAVAGTGEGGAGASAGTAAPGSLSEEVVTAIKDKGKELTRGRKKRALPADTVTAAALSVASPPTATFTPHSSSAPGITAVAVHPAADKAHLVLTGGVDKAALLFDTEAGRVLARAEGHGKRVSAVAWHPHRDVFFTASHDSCVRIWSNTTLPATSYGGSYAAAATLRPHRSGPGAHEITALSAHPLGDFILTASRDGSWAMCDAAAGAVVLHAPPAADAAPYAIESAQLHVDGMLLLAGCGDGQVRVFDVRTGSAAATLAGHVAGSPVGAIACSENGYYVATGGADGQVRVWDLRHVTCTKTLAAAAPDAHDEAAVTAAAAAPGHGITALAFDPAGSFVAAGTSAGAVVTWESKAWAPIGPIRKDATAAITGLQWVSWGHRLVSSSMDRALRVQRF